MGCRGCGVCGWAGGQAANGSNSRAPPAPEGGPVSSPSPLLGFSGLSGPDHSCPGRVPRTAGMTRWEVTFWSSGPQGLPKAAPVMSAGNRPQPQTHASRQTSVAALLTKSIPGKAGTGVTAPTPISPPDSFLVDTGSPCSLQAWGEGNGSLRFPTGASRGIPSPTDCLPSELGLSQLLKSWHTDWKVSTKRLGVPSLAQPPQPSPRTQRCLLVQAGHRPAGREAALAQRVKSMRTPRTSPRSVCKIFPGSCHQAKRVLQSEAGKVSVMGHRAHFPNWALPAGNYLGLSLGPPACALRASCSGCEL